VDLFSDNEESSTSVNLLASEWMKTLYP